jgi:hypothetical protein
MVREERVNPGAPSVTSCRKKLVPSVTQRPVSTELEEPAAEMSSPFGEARRIWT